MKTYLINCTGSSAKQSAEAVTDRSPGDFCVITSTSRKTTDVPPASVDNMSPYNRHGTALDTH